MTKNTTEWLTDRIDAIHRHGVTASEYWTLLDDCKAELAKQAERVAALEELVRQWREYVNEIRVDAWEAEGRKIVFLTCADELAAVLREGKE